MPEATEQVALLKVVIGLQLLQIAVFVGYSLGVLSRLREIEPTIARLAQWLKGVTAVRRVRAVRREQRRESRRPNS